MKPLKPLAILALFSCACLCSDGSAETRAGSETYFKSLFKGSQNEKSDPDDGNLDSFQVVPANLAAGDTADYTLYFQLDGETFGSLNRGGFSFSFPDGFNLSLVQQVEVRDDCPSITYKVDRTEISDGLLTLFLKRRRHKNGQSHDCEDEDRSVNVEVFLAAIGNPTLAGRYRLAGLAFDRDQAIVAGPNLSEEFKIISGPLHAIDISPGDDTTLRAGDFLVFSAVGTDQFGNVIEGLEFQWALAEGSDSIGDFSGSVFQALRVGQGSVMAISGSVSGQSGWITVVPGELARMVLDVFSNQVVGQPLLQQAQITLYDAHDNLKTDYNLSQKPITLVPSNGTLEPDIVDDQALFSDGVVNLLPVGITYLGPSAVIDVFATNGEVTSSAVEVSFNGYDVLAVLDADGATISQVFSGAENRVSVVVRNNGALKPLSSPNVRAYFRFAGGLTQTSFPPNSNGIVDTIPMVLPIVQHSSSTDLLVIELVAEYLIEGQTHTTTDEWELPVSIIAPYQFAVVANSFRPDTVYPGEPFVISFEVSAQGFDGPVDSTDLVIELAEEPGDSGLLIIYEGSPAFDSFEDGVVGYRGLEAVVTAQAGLQPGWYAVKLDYGLISGGVRFELVDNFPDSILVLPEVQANYVAGSFEPTTVYAGAETAFRFYVNLGNDFPFNILAGNARFTIYGSSFSVSTNLIFPGDSLLPGDNSFETEMIFIPLSQLGENLRVSAFLRLVVPGVGNIFTFKADFENQTVLVVERPVAQIIEVDLLAPHSPRVNTEQPFQIRCRVANLSNSTLGPLELGLRSDGFSVFDSTLTLLSIDPNDTVDVHFNVTASPQPNSGEVFRVDILSTDISQLPPVDDIVLVTVERPAELEYVFSLFGVTDGLVDQGDDFRLMVELRNSGEAAVSDGTYVLTTGGVDFGAEDTTAGVITINRPLHFDFRAPSFDTMATFVFSLVDIPLDLNTNSPAIIEDTSFQFSIVVESLEADLLVGPEIIGSNLALPGRQKELFRLDLTNRGSSSITGIRLDEIVLAFTLLNLRPLDASSVVDLERTGFYEDGGSVATSSFSGNLLLLIFDDFIIAPSQTRSIVFAAKFTETVPSSFVLNLNRRDITAAFIEGPNAGEQVEITSRFDSDVLISQVYAAKGKTLEESFVVENNPFHPDVSPARFSYELSEPSAVEFRVFTLTGEEVYSRNLPEGSDGAAVGENEITWDGRNSAGHMVMNGVYIVSIKVVETVEQARIKVAVVK